MNTISRQPSLILFVGLCAALTSGCESMVSYEVGLRVAADIEPTPAVILLTFETKESPDDASGFFRSSRPVFGAIVCDAKEETVVRARNVFIGCGPREEESVEVTAWLAPFPDDWDAAGTCALNARKHREQHPRQSDRPDGNWIKLKDGRELQADQSGWDALAREAMSKKVVRWGGRDLRQRLTFDCGGYLTVDELAVPATP